MTPSIASIAGIDISRDHLDAALHPGGEMRRFTNDRPGYTALLRWLDQLAVQRVTFEATGPCRDTLTIAPIGAALAQATAPLAKL